MMNLSTVILCLSVCLGLTVGQVQLRVYRGTLVHSRVLEQIEVLQDYLLGFDENLGEVSSIECVCSVFCTTIPHAVAIPLNMLHLHTKFILGECTALWGRA